MGRCSFGNSIVTNCKRSTFNKHQEAVTDGRTRRPGGDSTLIIVNLDSEIVGPDRYILQYILIGWGGGLSQLGGTVVEFDFGDGSVAIGRSSRDDDVRRRSISRTGRRLNIAHHRRCVAPGCASAPATPQ